MDRSLHLLYSRVKRHLQAREPAPSSAHSLSQTDVGTTRIKMATLIMVSHCFLKFFEKKKKKKNVGLRSILWGHWYPLYQISDDSAHGFHCFKYSKPVIYGHCFRRPPALYGHSWSLYFCDSLDLMFVWLSFATSPAFYGYLLLKKLKALQNRFYCTTCNEHLFSLNTFFKHLIWRNFNYFSVKSQF